jgi:hypothetical protein
MLADAAISSAHRLTTSMHSATARRSPSLANLLNRFAVVHEEGLVHEDDAAGGGEVTPSPAECTETPAGFPVHEEGLEPPHLAVPEPKSDWRVSRRRQM